MKYIIIFVIIATLIGVELLYFQHISFPFLKKFISNTKETVLEAKREIENERKN
jgi:hypothetical protein